MLSNQLEEKTLLSRQSLAKRWDFTSTQVIEKYEAEGIITRVPKIPSPRYSVDEILEIETIGNLNPLSPKERRRLETIIEKLTIERDFYKKKLESIRLQII